MSWTRSRPSKRTVFSMLMLLSVLVLLLPSRWSDALKNAGQLLVAPMDWLYGLSHDTAASLSDLDPANNHARFDRQALLNELASQVALTEQLREENAGLRALRDGRLPPPPPLLPAKAVARDLVAWRDTVLLERGSSRGVNRKDWVASRFFVNQGHAARVEKGHVVLARECLLGRIEQVSPYMARVQLFSDIDSHRIEVRVGTMTEDGFAFVDYPCSLCGLGRGRMAIQDVPHRYVQDLADREPGDDARRIQVGDLVLSAPGRLGLPRPLVIGRITGLEENHKKRLVVSLLVEPVVAIEEIRDVLIIPLVPTERMPFPEQRG